MKIHYFQRYHSKENVDTANTMLMLSRLYQYNADKFYLFLNDLILKESDTVEINFDLQHSGNSSVPDAVISQKSFKVVVETKLYNNFSQNQLLNHLKQFNTEEIKVLLTLDPLPIKTNFLEEFKKSLEEYNSQNIEKLLTPIKHIHITFNELIKSIEDVIDDRDTEILDILDDFKSCCMEEGLIPDGDNWMRAVCSGTTLNDNLELNLYYDKVSQGYSQHGYVGLYNKKRIIAIGKLSKIIKASYQNNQFTYSLIEGSEITEQDLNNIKEAISRSEKYGFSDEEKYYFLVDKFIETNFIKASKYPLWKAKLFNLSEILNVDELPDVENIANILKNKTWEEFL